jgi:uncharacterized protein YxeA
MKNVIAVLLTLVFCFVALGDFEICTATTDQVSPAVASNGTDYLAVWEDNRAGVTNKNIYAQAIYGTGSLMSYVFPPRHNSRKSDKARNMFLRGHLFYCFL